MQRARGDAALNLGHDRRGKRGQYADVTRAPVAGFFIQGAEGAKDVPIVGSERDPGVGSGHGAALREGGLGPRIRHHERHTGADDILAERCFERVPAGRSGTVTTGHALEVLTIGVDKRDENRGSVEELRRETREGVQTVLCGCLEKS